MNVHAVFRHVFWKGFTEMIMTCVGIKLTRIYVKQDTSPSSTEFLSQNIGQRSFI